MMNITSKSRYALKIMLDLAHYSEGSLAHRADVASRQSIPLDYMDQILSRLRDAALIESTRGRSGGYRLARIPSSISALDVFMAVEDAFAPVSCLHEPGAGSCQLESFCGAKDAWHDISHAIRHALSGILLSDLVAKDQGVLPVRSVVSPPQECRAPTRRA